MAYGYSNFQVYAQALHCCPAYFARHKVDLDAGSVVANPLTQRATIPRPPVELKTVASPSEVAVAGAGASMPSGGGAPTASVARPPAPAARRPRTAAADTDDGVAEDDAV